MTEGITSPDGEAIPVEVSGDHRTPRVTVSSEVNADIAEHRFEPYDWQRALSANVAANAEKTAARRREREQLARARNAGLALRHAAKLNRGTARPPVNTIPADQSGSQQ